MRILAVHDGHNASACFLSDGRIELAVQEERFSRVKNHSCFPERSIRYILEKTRLHPSQIDRFVFSSTHMPRNKTREELMQEYRQSSAVKTRLRRALKHTPVLHVFMQRRTQERIAQAMAMGFSRAGVCFEDHHRSHAAAAYFGCPWWQEEPILVLTNDAGGDGLCATVSIGEEGKLNRIAGVPVSESIGYVYSMVTFLLGMVPEEHEYKLMGMAPYSSADKNRPVKEDLQRLFGFVSDDAGLTWLRRNGCPPTQYSYRFFHGLLETRRFDCVCGGLQDFCEEMLLRWVRNCIRSTGIGKLALSGGVFMNVKANKRIMELPEVESVYIAPSCGDETNCLGAALDTYSRERRKKPDLPPLQPLTSLYLGPEFGDKAVAGALAASGVHYMHHHDVERNIAELLAAGEVVARFKGPMEFGARALGNRSILANPSRRDVIRIINEMIKCRDFWMPFAPSLLPERINDYVVNPKNIDAPYMIICFDTRSEHRKDLLAASHPYDYTVRPQVVLPNWNPSYYALLKYFEGMTGIGGVLNTSFNLHGYPIVCTPEDALKVFHESGLRYMGIGNFLVRKKP
jgi:carbamoyltransferase